MKKTNMKKSSTKLTTRETRALIVIGVSVVVLSLSIGLGVFYGTSTSETSPATTPVDTTTYDSSKVYKFDENNKGTDVTTQYVTAQSLTNNGLYEYTTSGGFGSNVQNNYLPKAGLTNNGLYEYTTAGGLGSNVKSNYLLETGLTNNGLYEYTTAGGLGSNVKNNYLLKTGLTNGALYKYSTTSGLGSDVKNNYLNKEDVFLVQAQESGAITSGRGNGILVSLEDNKRIVKRHYRIYDSETSTGPSVGFINVPNGATKTLYLTAAAAVTTGDNFELISTSIIPGNWVALIEMSVTNTNGTLTGKFVKGHLGNSGDSNRTNNFATFSPKRIRENTIDPGDTTVNDRAVWFNGQPKTPAGRVAIDIPKTTLDFLFKKLT